MAIVSGSTCRVCLVEDEENLSLTDANTEKQLKLVKEYTGLDMVTSWKENLPTVICKKCFSEVIVVVNFIRKCRTSYEKLEKISTETIESFLKIKDDVEIKEELDVSTDTKIKVEVDDDSHHYEDTPDLYSDSDTKDPIYEYKRKYTRTKEKKQTEFPCEYCDFKANCKSSLVSHTRRHTGERPFVCTQCHKSFTQSGTLKEHIARLHDRKLLFRKTCVCDYCGKVCVRKNELRAHLRVHTKEKPFTCEICNVSFSQQGSLYTHMKRHKGEKRFACHVCGTCFVTSSGLSSHMLVHSDEKNYTCHICDKAVKTAKSLLKHIAQIHTNSKAYVCDKCGARFSQKGNLKQHLVARHSERSGDCDVCNKFFSDLTTHKRFHTGEKPYKCPICAKEYSKKAHLTLHVKRHGESSKFRCTFDGCKEGFPMECQLDFHMRKFHTKKYAHKCTGCGKGFYRLTDLNRHTNLNPLCKSVVLANTSDADTKDSCDN